MQTMQTHVHLLWFLAENSSDSDDMLRKSPAYNIIGIIMGMSYFTFITRSGII